MEAPKEAVRAFWDAAACGEVYATGSTPEERFASQARSRYELEPYIASFARFEDGTGKDVLEIGVGMGADHAEWARHAPRSLTGIDLTGTAIEWTRERFAARGLTSDLRVADAEALPFADASFDLVYSWGVLHHSPNTERAIEELHRVLRPGGEVRIMMYHRPSIVGILLWLRYALLRGRPLQSMRSMYARHLESPGTKGYTVREGRSLMASFPDVRVRSMVSFGDMLEGAVGQRHEGAGLALAKRYWPRFLIRRMHWLGLTLLIEARR